MEEKINVEKLEEVKVTNKSSMILSIIGTIFLLISFVLAGFFLSLAMPYITGTEDLGSAFGIIVGIIYFLLPGVISSIISTILNILAWKKASDGKNKIYKLITFVLSIVTLIALVGSFIYLNIK